MNHLDSNFIFINIPVEHIKFLKIIGNNQIIIFITCLHFLQSVAYILGA